MHQNTILKLLRAQEDGTYLSGEELSRALHITRAAVWKEIQALRGEGYEIESKTRRGYRLRAAPEAVTPEALGLQVQDQVALPILLINDGRVMTDNLRASGRDQAWLEEQLKSRKLASPREVFLLTVDESGRVECAKKEAAA